MTTQQFTHRLNEGIAHHRAGRLDRAEAIYRQLAPAAAKVALVFDVWGQLAEQQGRLEDAIRLYTQASRIDETSASVAIRLAGAYIASAKIADAERVMRRAVQKNDRSAQAWTGLAFTLKLQGRFPEAVAANEKAVTLDPKFVDGWLHYGLTLGLVGKNQLALQQHEKALAINPHHAHAHYGRAESLHKVYRIEEAIAEYDTFLKVEPNHLEARSYRLFALENSDTMTREQLFAEHRAYGQLVGRGPDMLPGYDLSPDKRLRVAILSPDFRTHSCAYFIEPLLERLDPAQFELYLYHDHFSEDAISARLKKLAKVWRKFVGQPHTAVERAIRADRPDILIDLTGHIGNMIRLPIFAKRLAPVQITYLGYPDTTGVPAMDYRFTDAIADPIGEADAFAIEKLVRFAPVAWTYQPPIEAPEIAPLPCAAGAPVMFGCFNSPTKFTDSLFRMWSQILEQVPNSRLLLKGRDFEESAVRDHMLARLKNNGVALDRLELLPRTPTTLEHLRQYARVDIALDTYPYTGTTTTCEALWMGRPVVTIRGDRHAARVGTSLLTAAGHTEWIASDRAGYVRLAVELAQNPANTQSVSARLRDDLRRSPLLDYAGQAACFARALRECWQSKVGVQTAAA